MKINFTPIALAVMVLLAASCKKDSIPDVAGQKFSDSKGTYLILSKQDWAAIKQNQGGQVSLFISGLTNANNITIATAGDGVAGTNQVAIGQDKQFAGEFIMSFSVSSRQTGIFNESTMLKVYKGNDVLEVPLNSGDLQY